MSETQPKPPQAAPSSKDERTLFINLQTQVCRREKKYPEGNPMRDCHLGLEKIDTRVCRFCTWFDIAEQKPVANLTGDHIVKFLDFMKTIRDEEDKAHAP